MESLNKEKCPNYTLIYLVNSIWGKVQRIKWKLSGQIIIGLNTSSEQDKIQKNTDLFKQWIINTFSYILFLLFTDFWDDSSFLRSWKTGLIQTSWTEKLSLQKLHMILSAFHFFNIYYTICWSHHGGDNIWK